MIQDFSQEVKQKMLSSTEINSTFGDHVRDNIGDSK